MKNKNNNFKIGDDVVLCGYSCYKDFRTPKKEGTVIAVFENSIKVKTKFLFIFNITELWGIDSRNYHIERNTLLDFKI